MSNFEEDEKVRTAEYREDEIRQIIYDHMPLPTSRACWECKEIFESGIAASRHIFEAVQFYLRQNAVSEPEDVPQDFDDNEYFGFTLRED